MCARRPAASPTPAAPAQPLSLCRGKLRVFTVLCEQYQPSLRRDPMYNEVRGGVRGSYYKVRMQH